VRESTKGEADNLSFEIDHSQMCVWKLVLNESREHS
jgi:hypothetical protein